jgi:peptidoglycan glycosyltransferase
VNAPLRRLAVACMVLFALLLVNANYVQVVQAGRLRNDPHNRRVLLAAYERQRGPILAGRAELARSRATDDQLKYLRSYPGGSLYAPATGFFSLIYGATGIERVDNPLLSGDDDRLFVRQVGDLITGRSSQGGAVVLTLNRAAQAAAGRGLAGKRGAVVALDPATGAILALASSPSYDPNVLSSHDPASIRAAYDRLSKDPTEPLKNRAIAEAYPPGSLFKVVTAAAALSTGRYTPDTRVPSPTRLKLPLTNRFLDNFGGETCGDGRTTSLADALRISCNTAFAGVGLAVGATALRNQAEAFGIDGELRVPLPVARSRFPAELDAPQTALSAIGQFDVRLTPMQAAMIAAGVANSGVVMRPYLVQEVQTPSLATLDAAEPRELARAISPQVADALTSMMRLVVAEGTGKAARIPGVDVAGKTGTAQHAVGEPPHAWFIGFAPASAPKVAVAVLVEDGGGLGSDATGGKLAAPIARDVIRAVLGP